MSPIFKISLMLTAAIILLSCGGADAPSLLIDTDNNKPQKLTKANSSVELENKIKASLMAHYGRISEPEYYLASAEDNQSAVTYSSTNTQEASVDEADRLKTDGDYLYFSKVTSSEINIIKANKNEPTLVSSLEIDTFNDGVVKGIYLLEAPKQVIAISGDGSFNASIWNNWFEPTFWQKRKTELFTIDVSDPTSPQQTHKLSVDGQLISSRKIGNTLYLATRHTPYITDLIDYPADNNDVARNQQLIEASSLSKLLPQYQINSQASQPLFGPNECFVIDAATSNYQQSSVISLLAIDLSNLQSKPTGQCFSGDTETLYASSEAIYLATTQYSYTDDGDGLVYDGQPYTNIHKFSLAETTPSYTGTGSIAGHLGWQQDLKPFRMSEHEGVLRVISYVGEQADSESSPARLYTLAESSTDNTLETLAKLPNATRPAPLGKVGEQIYATRFIGKRGYLVTFRMTDPLYVLDLSDPSDPFIASALEIDGYSDYLHPVGENYLLGIGKSAVADTTDGDGRGAWYQGVKLSLIDISNPAEPFEKQTIDIGKRGTQTAVTRTHNALTSLQKGDTLQVALPVSLHESVDERIAHDFGKPWFNYQWTRDELHRLNINTVSGEITTLPTVVATPANPNPYYNWSWPYDRSAIIDESVYYLHEDTVVAY